MFGLAVAIIVGLAMVLTTGCMESADKKEARMLCKVLNKNAEAVRQAIVNYNNSMEEIARFANGIEAKNPLPYQLQQFSQQCRMFKDKAYAADGPFPRIQGELSALKLTTASAQTVREEVNRKLNEGFSNAQDVGGMLNTAANVYPTLGFGQYPLIMDQIGSKTQQSVLPTDVIPAALTKLREKYQLTDEDIRP
jgi:hypothetical protein